MVCFYIYLHLVDFMLIFISNISKYTVPHGFRGFFSPASFVNGSRQAAPEGAKMGAGSSMVMAFVLA